MSYTALYRKFRPQEFEDVRGQEHIVTTLRNQIKADRVGHAYLFCGTRGTGKTTIAKIFAKAVNCQSPVDGSPCGECPSCKAIREGVSMNVIEIDAASNNGVDNIREIREEVAYSPTEGKYKVYIVDEVHMLSIGAFNALLKTLEEPPSYVIFILATTEAHKIPITILSRCQRYDFRRITIDVIAGRLTELIRAEGVEAEEKAIRYIARAGDGSMRDSISLLDRCIAFYLGQELTYDRALDVLGAVDTEVFGQMLRRVLSQDVGGVIAGLEELMIQGREPGQFVTDFTWYLRNLLLLQCSEDMEDVLDISTENLRLMKEEAQMTEPELLMRFIRIFSELSNQIRYAAQKRILIEIALVKLCRPQMEQQSDAILARLAQLEKRMEEGIPMAPSGSGADPSLKGIAKDDAALARPALLPEAIPEDVEQAVRGWHSILPDMPGAMRAYLKKAHLSLAGDGSLLIVLEDQVAEGFLRSQEHQAELEGIISRKIGKAIRVQFERNDTGRPAQETFPDLEQIIHFPVDEEE